MFTEKMQRPENQKQAAPLLAHSACSYYCLPYQTQSSPFPDFAPVSQYPNSHPFLASPAGSEPPKQSLQDSAPAICTRGHVLSTPEHLWL